MTASASATCAKSAAFLDAATDWSAEARAATAADAAASADVDTVTPTAPGVTAPKVKPLTVTTTAEAGMIAEPVVMTIEVAPVVPHVPVSPATLLVPANIAEGVTPGAKKAEG